MAAEDSGKHQGQELRWVYNSTLKKKIRVWVDVKPSTVESTIEKATKDGDLQAFNEASEELSIHRNEYDFEAVAQKGNAQVQRIHDPRKEEVVVPAKPYNGQKVADTPKVEVQQTKPFNITAGQRIYAGIEYIIGNEIGRGGFGQVHEATTSDGLVKVAIKIIKPDAPNRDNLLKSLKSEATVNGYFAGHPNFVNLRYLHVNPDSSIYAVFDRVKGILEKPGLDTLVKAHLEQGLVPAIDPAVFLIYKALNIVTELHSFESEEHGIEDGLAHKDISLDNLLIHFTGTLKLIDLGNADEIYDTKLVGKPWSISPELMRACAFNSVGGMNKEKYKKTDVWNLALVTYQLLTGRSPFYPNYGSVALPKFEQPLLESVAKFRLDPGSVPPVEDLLSLDCVTQDVIEPLARAIAEGMNSDPEKRIYASRLLTLLSKGYLFNEQIAGQGMNEKGLKAYLRFFNAYRKTKQGKLNDSERKSFEKMFPGLIAGDEVNLDQVLDGDKEGYQERLAMIAMTNHRRAAAEDPRYGANKPLKETHYTSAGKHRTYREVLRTFEDAFGQEIVHQVVLEHCLQLKETEKNEYLARAQKGEVQLDYKVLNRFDYEIDRIAKFPTHVLKDKIRQSIADGMRNRGTAVDVPAALNRLERGEAEKKTNMLIYNKIMSKLSLYKSGDII